MKQQTINFDVCLVFKKISHHSERSGYDQLVKYLNPTTKLNPTKDEVSYFIKKIRSLIWRHKGKQWYSADSLKMEINVLTKFFFTNKTIYHFIYGENDFRYTGLVRKIKKTNKIMCTYHQPPDVFAKIVKNKKHLKNLDAAIVVGTNQLNYFEDLVGKGRVYFVPHGVDTDFFRPLNIGGNNKRGRNRICLFVGQWLRDFQCLREIIRLISKIDSDVKFEVISTENRVSELNGLNNLKSKSNLSDEDLLSSYHRADLLILPLTNCTANNSILEAMSSGLPVVTTDVGGVRDYLDESCAFLAPKGDAETIVKKVLLLLENEELRTQIGKAAREKALKEFDWRVITKKMLEVYKKVLEP